MNVHAGSVKQSTILNDAILPNRGSKAGLLERTFSLMFRGLVYPQIWEDPVADMEALDIGRDHHIVTIASGGCNALSYLRADPAKITAVDLNTAHIALNRLKSVAAQQLDSHEAFFRFFGEANSKDNLALYRDRLRPHLDAASRKYWDGRDHFGQRRINGFARGFYRKGLLGNFIGLVHILGRLGGARPSLMMAARTREEQIDLFDRHIGPLFQKKLMRFLCSNPMALFGLGIPPAQYRALAGESHMADVLHERTRKLACDFAIADNYFAQQAFGRAYQSAEPGSVPPYLEAASFAWLGERSQKLEIRHQNFIEFLSSQDARSLDRYVLLDAQDWMTDQQLNRLWSEIGRTAKPGARVLFRTAAEETLLPGRVTDELLSAWDYDADLSQALTRKDRSAIYGAMHLYRLK
ncbi:MAG: S-adenosylmethionine--diacylglycerol 3-amino-3-carboxypropyl transferase [Sphingopyxis sp.]|nr:MAG: S-adenosylmethionine--diacylglycerol 3-amino-3-carboxypropyl transferase [Sphingopyxis sp.]